MVLSTSLFTGCNPKDHSNTTTKEHASDKSAEVKPDETKDIFSKTGLPIIKSENEMIFEFLGQSHDPDENLAENKVFKQIQQDTGVEINFTMIPSESWNEKKNLVFASGDYPDAFYGMSPLTSEDVGKYGPKGVLVSINDYLDYAPRLKEVLKDETIAQFSYHLDGNIYSLPNIVSSGFSSLEAVYINKKLLADRGLSVPSTTDEFFDAMMALKGIDTDGNGETKDNFPIGFTFKNTPLNRETKREHFYLMGPFGRTDNPMHIVPEDGDVVFTANQVAWKDATKFLHKLYANGLIDPEAFTLSESHYKSKAKELKYSVISEWSNGWMQHSDKTNYDDWALLPPLKGPEGHQEWNNALHGYGYGSFAITNSCKNPEVLVRWIDHTFNYDVSLQLENGIKNPAEGKCGIVNDPKDGLDYCNWGEKPEGISWEEYARSTRPNVNSVKILTYDMYKGNFKFDPDVKRDLACPLYEPFLSEEPYTLPYLFTEEQIKNLTLIQTDLLDYIYKTQARWITEGGIDEEWDEYTAQLDALNLDEYLEIYRDAYRTLKAKSK